MNVNANDDNNNMHILTHHKIITAEHRYSQGMQWLKEHPQSENWKFGGLNLEGML